MFPWTELPGTIWATAPGAWGYRFPPRWGRPLYLKLSRHPRGCPDCMIHQTSMFMRRYSVRLYS